MLDRQPNGDSRGDDELIAAAPHDPDAFAELYRRYAGRMYRYLCTYVDRQEDAADLMQMVFLRAMLALPRYRSEGSTHTGIGIPIPGDLIIPRPAVL